jgi:hypothetical protein
MGPLFAPLLLIANGRTRCSCGVADLPGGGTGYRPSAGSVAGATKDDRVNIAYDRVRFICEVHNISPAKLLGSILAHELGHVLLGENHSPYGIMMATFRKQELQHVEIGDLLFSRSQATQMRARLQVVGVRAGVPKGAAK